MTIGIIVGIIVVSIVGLFLIRHTVRLFIRLTIAGVVLLLVVGLFAWRYWANNNSGQDNHPAKTRKK